MSKTDTPTALLDSATEARLVADAQGGDRGAFLELTRHYQRPLYRLAFALTRREADSVALVEETFGRAWGSLHEYPSGRRFFPWLLRIARNLLSVRQPARTERDLEDPVVAAFTSLRQDEQLAVALLQAGPFRYEEIAALLYVPVGTVILRVSQARNTMFAGLGGARRGAS